MQRLHTYKENSKSTFLKKALIWANRHTHFSLHLNNDIKYPHGGFKEILAIGAKRVLKFKEGEAFNSIKKFHQDSWLFGYLGYDLKNEIEKLNSKNPDHVQFPDLVFFEPQHIIYFASDGFRIESEDPNLLSKIESSQVTDKPSSFSEPAALVSKNTYLKHIQSLRQHIEDGDCYEINFCQGFQGEVIEWNPVHTFLELDRVSPKPFACFQKFDSHYIISASPERFLKKEGQKIISQPIKGTRPRKNSPEEDEKLRVELRNSEKELAENMMIVDLVRNDLARTAKTGSVKVEEMFGIYSFQQVHQMISTVVSEVREDVHFVDVIRLAFPMGSMTGAPKIKVMQLIEKYENTKRGAFSGAAGYIEPSGDFDFNVLIRSLFINEAKKAYSFQVGSAITYDSIAEEEYEECMVKAKALFEILYTTEKQPTF